VAHDCPTCETLIQVRIVVGVVPNGQQCVG